jgi:hypothetical protein
LSRHEVAEGTTAFRFEKPLNWRFKSGQYLDITLFDPSEMDAEPVAVVESKSGTVCACDVSSANCIGGLYRCYVDSSLYFGSVRDGYRALRAF